MKRMAPHSRRMHGRGLACCGAEPREAERRDAFTTSHAKDTPTLVPQVPLGPGRFRPFVAPRSSAKALGQMTYVTRVSCVSNLELASHVSHEPDGKVIRG